MLSSIARAGVRRVGAAAARPSPNRVFQSIWQIQRLRTHENPDGALPSTGFSFILRRSLATHATTSTSSAKPKAKKSPKKAARSPKKKVAAESKSAKKKKDLTVEEKAKLRIKELKAVALTRPKAKPETAWTVLMAEYLTENAAPGTKMGQLLIAASAKYKSISPSELENYNRKANQNKEKNETVLKEWIESHTPEQIRLANNARVLLKRMTGKHYGMPLVDDRIPKQRRNAYVIFAQDKWASGDWKGLKAVDVVRLIHKEFHELPESEQQAYRDRSNADRMRYMREYKVAFNRDPNFVVKDAAKSA